MNHNFPYIRSLFFSRTRILQRLSVNSVFLVGAFYALDTKLTSLIALKIIFGYLLLSFLISSAIYFYNDSTDFFIDKKNIKKKDRYSNYNITQKDLLNYSYFLGIVSLIVAFLFNYIFFIITVLMFVNQILYSNKSIRLKERKVLGVISGSAINPVLRFVAGFLLFGQSMSIPILLIIFFVVNQVISYMLYRIKFDNNDYYINKQNIYLLYLANLVIFILLILNSYLFIAPMIIGILPLASIILVAFILLFYLSFKIIKIKPYCKLELTFLFYIIFNISLSALIYIY